MIRQFKSAAILWAQEAALLLREMEKYEVLGVKKPPNAHSPVGCTTCVRDNKLVQRQSNSQPMI